MENVFKRGIPKALKLSIYTVFPTSCTKIELCIVFFLEIRKAKRNPYFSRQSSGIEIRVL